MINVILLATIIVFVGFLVFISLTFPELAYQLGASRGPISWWSLIVLYSVAWAVVFALVQMRRYHDRDKSGWWLLLCLVPGIVYSATGSDEISSLVAIAIFIWQFIELGFLPGTPGANKYGLTT